MITVTQAAVDKITEFLAGNENTGKNILRIQIEGYG